MITKIHIEKVATYTSGVEFCPKKINFIYGSNGTGKSTLSRVLNNEVSFPTCNVEWGSGIKEEIVVYNRDFIEKNFHVDTNLKGIFSLGEESIEVQKKIEEKRKKIDEFEADKINVKNKLDEIISEQDNLREKVEKQCWNVQKIYGEEFSDALIGFRNKTKSFCDQCLKYFNTLVKENVSTLEELRIMYQAAFSKTASKDDKYNNLPIFEINSLDTNELLSTVIVGKNDTPIGTFIEYLKASDWVKMGVEYAKKVPGKCPYCQQSLPHNIQNDIEAYFDKKYEDSKTKLDNYEKAYSSMALTVKSVIQEIDNKRYAYIDYSEFDKKKIVLLSKIENNQRIIQTKVKSLSKAVEIETIINIASELAKMIDKFNEKIEKNNELVENQGRSKTECKEKLWNFLTLQCFDDISEFTKEFEGKDKGRKKLLEKKNQLEETINNLKAEIDTEEASLTSVKPTVNAINSLLKEFGFNGFMLEVNEEKIGTYRIVRPSGEDAIKTLSEGEYNFISFLYFYYLCFGSQKKTGLTVKKVLVIDDPISSMDSNVLFIVSTLVKSIIAYCKENEKGIDQVIILTHNVYFHKEITLWGNKNALPSTQTRYYILRKVAEETTIQEYKDNPIKTSYELLWKELKNENIGSSNALMNVMRRILEHYFMIVGGIDYEKIINQIEGTDKIICKALISFINDGSHSVFEDLIFTPDDGDIENYKRVFKMVFKKLGHIDHYNMMMNKS